MAETPKDCKSPFDRQNLGPTPGLANSRFLTDCYAFMPHFYTFDAPERGFTLPKLHTLVQGL